MSTAANAMHPLMGIEVSNIKNFTHWMRVWESSMSFECRMGLLESLEDKEYWHFDYRFLQTSQVLIFLLDIAYGYESNRNFGEGQDSFRRAKLASRALRILCEKFFSLASRDDGFCRQRLFAALFNKDGESARAKLMWFFLCSHSIIIVREGDDDDDQRLIRHGLAVREFLLGFAEHSWEVELDDPGQTSLMRRYSVRVFSFYRVLFQSLVRKELDEGCEAVLRQLVFGRELDLLSREGKPERRIPVTIQEAVFGGSEAAYLLSLWGVYQDARLSMTGSLVLG